MKTPAARPLRVLPVLCALLLGLFCAKAFVINPRLYAGKSSIPADATDYVWTFVALVLSALFYHTFSRRGLRPKAGEAVCGLLFGFVNYFATTLFAYDSWAFAGDTVSWATIVLKCLGQGVTMMAALTLAGDLLTRRPRELSPLRVPDILARLRDFYRAHTALASFLLFLVCWSPYLVAFYPGTVVSDMALMFEQFEGITPMTTWHSVFTTWVFGGCVRAGRLLGSDNLGCCLYMLLQTLAMGWALALAVRAVRRCKLGPRWQVAALAFFALFPVWPVYCVTISKDALYTASLLVLLLMTIRLVRERRARPGTLVLYALSGLLTCLWRNNGMYVALPSMALAALCLFKGGTRWAAWGAAACVAASALLFHNALVPALGVVDNTASGLYSIAFQQSARTLRDRSRAVTDEERAAIDRVLDADEIAGLYQPWISDPVKYTFRQFGQGAEAEKAALAEYRGTWFSMLKKYPVTYLQAFMANNRGYYAFTPMYTGITYSQQAGARFVFTTYWIEGEGELYTTQPAALKPLRDLLSGLANRLRTLPLLMMLLTCPPYTWLLVACGLSLAHKRRWRDLALLAPAALSFAVCLLSPVDDYFRYFLPIVAMALPLAAYVKSDAPPEVQPHA